MKTRIITTLAVLTLFALAIAAYAYNRGNTTTTATAAACCCKNGSDSCPMMGKDHDDKGEHAKMSCCKKHDGEHATVEGHECCGCCGDSCPMKKDGAAAVSSDGKTCCDNCDCCKDKAKTSV